MDKQQAPEVSLEQQIKELMDELREEVYKASYKGQMQAIREITTRLRLLWHQLNNRRKDTV